MYTPDRMWPAVFNPRGLRFPRTTAEAFRDAEWGCAIKRYRKPPMPLAERIVIAASLAAIAIVGLMAWAGMLPGGAS